MPRPSFSHIVVALAGALLAACGAPAAAEPSPAPPPAEAGGLPASCQSAEAGAAAYVNVLAGYCLLTPDRFEVRPDDPAAVLIVGPALSDGPEPVRAMLVIAQIKPVDGRTLSQVIDAEVAQYAGLPITRTPSRLGGQPAEVVEGLPGVTGSRQVFVIHSGRLYRLTVQPVDAAFPQAEPDVSELWDSVTRSFTFLP